VKSFVAIGDRRPDWAMEYEAARERLLRDPDVEVEEHDLFYFNLTSERQACRSPTP